MNAGDIVISIENIYYKYDDGTEALRGVTLRVKRGEIVALMGENGAGKTTLVKHINGLLKPQRGKVVVLGMDTRHTPVSRLARVVGMVFQNPDFQLFGETVEEEIKIALKNFGFPPSVIEKRVEWALKIFGLHKYRDRSPYTLSIGERKRLCIASILSYDPEIVILDEPTAGQDFLQKEKIAEILYMLKHQGKTVIIVTHDVEFALKRSDRVVIMKEGQIVADGPTREVLGRVDLLLQARLKPPQIAEAAHILSRKGLLARNELPLTPHELVRVLPIVGDNHGNP